MNTTAALLCELHAHSTWSDGVLQLRQLVDLYGENGFDVLCLTDHVVRGNDARSPRQNDRPEHVNALNFQLYLAEVRAECERALERYELLVIPGLELTFNDPDPSFAAHALAIGLDTFVSPDAGLEAALAEARAAGAALIAAHPYSARAAAATTRAKTARWGREWRSLQTLVDRFELANRTDIFDWVARAGLPAVASGDFHRPEHLATWKTLLPCEKDEQVVVAYLRSGLPAYLADWRVRTAEIAAAA
ncbi:MAG: PHP domain-containing protein [Gaiellaceae bacterium]